MSWYEWLFIGIFAAQMVGGAVGFWCAYDALRLNRKLQKRLEA